MGNVSCLQAIILNRLSINRVASFCGMVDEYAHKKQTGIKKRK